MSHEAQSRQTARKRADPDGPLTADSEAGHELPFRSELQRKALHLIALIIPAGMYLLGRTWSLLILLPLAVIALGADVLRTRSAAFARFIYRVFGFMMRPEERPPIGARPVINGATSVLISASVLALAFPLEVAVASFASFMVADAAAAVVGRTVGRTHWGQNPRTVEGSLAFVVFGLLTMLPISSEPILIVVAAVLAGAAVEIPRWSINDNVRVPLVMALVLTLL